MGDLAGEICKKVLCVTAYCPVPRTPGMHSGRRGGVAAAVAFSAARVCGRKRLGMADNGKKLTPW